MKTVICYKMKIPVYYNKGTQWESSCDSFLAYYTNKTVEAAQEEVNEINSTHPAKLWNSKPVNWEEVDYFFVSEQEEM